MYYLFDFFRPGLTFLFDLFITPSSAKSFNFSSIGRLSSFDTGGLTFSDFESTILFNTLFILRCSFSISARISGTITSTGLFPLPFIYLTATQIACTDVVVLAPTVHETRISTPGNTKLLNGYEVFISSDVPSAANVPVVNAGISCHVEAPV